MRAVSFETIRRHPGDGLGTWIGALAAALLAAGQLGAAERTLWQIGKLDHASIEFNSQWDFAQGKDPLFVVGESQPARDWSAFHPSDADPRGGNRIHPFTVKFRLNEEPRGVFYLIVDALFADPLVPQYSVEINGHKGRYYLDPVLSYDIGNPTWFDTPILSTRRLRVPIQSANLRRGENIVVLRCAGSSGAGLAPAAAVSPVASGLYYDAVEFTNDPAASKPTSLRATARPTIFYRRGAGGEVRELVSIAVESAAGMPVRGATLRAGGESYSCELASEYEFGETRCVMAVRELPGTVTGELEIHGDVRRDVFSVSLAPEKKWTLFEAPHNHLDPGYTDYRPKTAEAHNRNVDQIVEAIESNPQYRFNLDGSAILEDYWAHRDQTRQERAVKLLRDKRLGLPAQLFTLDTGLAPQELLIRLGYYSAELARRYGLSLELANQTDSPGQSWAVPSLLRAMGVSYFALACDQYRAPVLTYGKLDQKSPFWWEGPDGSKVLTWYSRHYIQMGFLFGRKGPVLDAGITSLPIFLQAYSSPAYKPDAALIFGTLTDNEPFNPQDVGFAEKWNREFAYPRVVVATMSEFFHYMEEHFRDSFLTLRGDGGASWEEMVASDALHSAMWRRAAARAPAAEAWASLGVIVNPGFAFPLEEDRDVWQNLLEYGEHSWGGMPVSWMHPEREQTRTLFRNKQAFARQSEIGVDDLLRRGLSQVATKVATAGNAVVVFNPLSWERDGLVEVDVPRGQVLVDAATAQPLALELVRRVEGEDYDTVRFWAKEVPPLGYRCYALADGAGSLPPARGGGGNPAEIENAFYRVTVDPARGGIASIYDKQLARELVDERSQYALGQYVYAGYGHEGESLIRQRTLFESTLLSYSTALPQPKLSVTSAAKGEIIALERTAWGQRLLLRSAEAHTPSILTEIRLFDGRKQIDLIATVEKNVVRAPEGVYFAFPFRAERPAIRYEIQNGWVDPTRDQLPGANKEWFAAQHWVSVTDGDHSVALALREAPLFTIGDIVRGRWPKEIRLQDGTVFSYVMNNYDGDDEKPYQGGTFTFHYSLTSNQGWDPAALARFGRELNTPLETNTVLIPRDKRDSSAAILSASPTAFVEIDSPAVLLSAWKGAEDGDGYLLRFYNATGESAAAKVQFPHFEFDQVYATNALEVNQRPLNSTGGQLLLSLRPHEVQSVRIKGLRVPQPRVK